MTEKVNDDVDLEAAHAEIAMLRTQLAVIIALIPATWYTDRDPVWRLEKLIEQWRKLHEVNARLEAEREADAPVIAAAKAYVDFMPTWCVSVEQCTDETKAIYAAVRERRERGRGGMSKINVIDTRGTKKHVRHLVRLQMGDGVKTECGRIVRNFWDAAQTSYFYTNGTRYSMPCRTCLPDDYAEAFSQDAERITASGGKWEPLPDAPMRCEDAEKGESDGNITQQR